MCYFVAVESGFQDSPGWSHSKLVENQQHISPVSEKQKIQVYHKNFPGHINNHPLFSLFVKVDYGIVLFVFLAALSRFLQGERSDKNRKFTKR